MKNKIYILHVGTMGADKNLTLMHAVTADRDTHQVKTEWVEFPIQAFLIETENNGYFLYDTGPNPKCMEKGYWADGAYTAWPTVVTEEQRIENQLAKCGVKPEDIKKVIISHMHMDHLGNIEQFTHADVYAPRADFETAQVTVHLCTDHNAHGPYIKPEVTAPVKQYHLLDEDVELAPGIEVIQLPGHTPGLLGLVVHSDDNTYILPSDALYSTANYGPPAQLSGTFYDNLTFMKSIEKVRKIAEKYNATIFFSHDGEFFKTVKTAPEFYD